jgi:putative transposase
MQISRENHRRRRGSCPHPSQSGANEFHRRRRRIAGVVEAVKTSTSKWMKTKDPTLRDFAWQTGYGSFSVSRSNLSAVTDYIQTQKEHHSKTDFQDEFRGFLRKHEVEYDERYVWD